MIWTGQDTRAAVRRTSVRTGATVLAALVIGTGAVGTGQAQATPPPAPRITTAHTATGLLAAPGGTLDEHLAVTNTGSSQVTLTSLISDRDGDLSSGHGTCATGGVLQPGDSYSCDYTSTFTGRTGATRIDTVTAMATDGSVTAQDSASSITTIGVAGATGAMQVCIRADNSKGKVTGTYDVDLLGGSVPLPVGVCTSPVPVPAGDVHVLLEDLPGVRVVTCGSAPVVRLLRYDPDNQRALERVVPSSTGPTVADSNGGPGPLRISTLTFVVRNRVVSDVGAITVCSVAGSGIAVGTPTPFTVGTRSISVPAGPEFIYGYCKTLTGFPRGVPVTITQDKVEGVYGLLGPVYPSEREVSRDYPSQSIVVTPAASRTFVVFGSSDNPCGARAHGAVAAVRAC